MGCTSSTTYHVDPHTGKETKKKRLGGAHPGRRRPQHQPYTPPEAAFGEGDNGTATQHFVAYGGGNALVLAKPDGSAESPASGGPEKQYIEVTLPDGVKAGDTIHVQAPSGKVNAIVVPSGFGPGSTFTVEFADETSTSPSPSSKPDNDDNNNQQQQQQNSQSSSPPQDDHGDDGFATGFHKDNWRPSATAVNEPEVHVASSSSDDYKNSNSHEYPSATATPVYTPQYSPPPSYPSKK